MVEVKLRFVDALAALRDGSALDALALQQVGLPFARTDTGRESRIIQIASLFACVWTQGTSSAFHFHLTRRI